jgi:hypothetical protein
MFLSVCSVNPSALLGSVVFGRVPLTESDWMLLTVLDVPAFGHRTLATRPVHFVSFPRAFCEFPPCNLACEIWTMT